MSASTERLANLTVSQARPGKPSGQWQFLWERSFVLHAVLIVDIGTTAQGQRLRGGAAEGQCGRRAAAMHAGDRLR